MSALVCGSSALLEADCELSSDASVPDQCGVSWWGWRLSLSQASPTPDWAPLSAVPDIACHRSLAACTRSRTPGEQRAQAARAPPQEGSWIAMRFCAAAMLMRARRTPPRQISAIACAAEACGGAQRLWRTISSRPRPHDQPRVRHLYVIYAHPKRTLIERASLASRR